MNDPEVFNVEQRQAETEHVQGEYAKQKLTAQKQEQLRQGEDLLIRMEEKVRSLGNELKDPTLSVEAKEEMKSKFLDLEILRDKTRSHYVTMKEEQARALAGAEHGDQLSAEAYERELDTIGAEIDNIERAANDIEEKNGLSDKDRTTLLDQLRIYPTIILELDERFPDAEDSQKRAALVERMSELRNRLRNPYHVDVKKNLDAAKNPSDVYRKVQATYSSMQHTLTLEQRRAMRTQIATLSSLVRRAEDQRMARVGSAILAAVSNATEHAPAIAHAAIATIPKQTPVAAKKGPLATLASAFRLK